MTITDLRITHFPPTLTQIVDAQGTLSNMATWDVWKAQAVKARAPEELAALGRETVRDYQQYGRAAEDPQGEQFCADGDHLRGRALKAPHTACWTSTPA